MRFAFIFVFFLLAVGFAVFVLTMFNTLKDVKCEDVCQEIQQQPQRQQQQQQQQMLQSLSDSVDSFELQLPSVEDLIAMVFWEQNSTAEIWDLIRREQEEGKRDKYFLPKSYISNEQNNHHNDISYTDGWQKEVYMVARELAKGIRTAKRESSEGKRVKVIDIGCGSGYKLATFIAPEFDTIGLETEPAISHLRKTYPELTWLDSGKPEQDLPQIDGLGETVLSHCDVAICADVVEHIRDPDVLLAFLKSLSCEAYVLSTPKREKMNRTGPPDGGLHVREWAFHEFQLYLMSMGFELVKSYDGVQNPSTQMHVVRLPRHE